MCATVYSSIENLLSHSSNVVCLLSHTQATSVDNLARCKHFTVTKPNFHSTFTKNLKNSRTREKIPRSNVDLLVTHTFFTQNSWFRFDECHNHYRIVWHFLAFKPRILLQFSNHFCQVLEFAVMMIASLFRPFFWQNKWRPFFALCLGGNVLFVSDVSIPKGNENTRDVSFCILLSSTLSKRITLTKKPSIPELSVSLTGAGGSSFSAFTWSFTGTGALA